MPGSNAQRELGGGRVNSGYQSKVVKNNRQLADNSSEARELGDMIVAALERNQLFITAALPLRVFPRSTVTKGERPSGRIWLIQSCRFPARPTGYAPISPRPFVSRPDEYDGGELVVDDVYGSHIVKLPPGDMVVYPGTSLHHVNPVTRGVRLAAFFWLQSMVKMMVRERCFSILTWLSTRSIKHCPTTPV